MGSSDDRLLDGLNLEGMKLKKKENGERSLTVVINID